MGEGQPLQSSEKWGGKAASGRSPEKGAQVVEGERKKTGSEECKRKKEGVNRFEEGSSLSMEDFILPVYLEVRPRKKMRSRRKGSFTDLGGRPFFY